MKGILFLAAFVAGVVLVVCLPTLTFGQSWLIWEPSAANRAIAIIDETDYWNSYVLPGIPVNFTNYLRYVRPFAPLAGWMNASTTGATFKTIGPWLQYGVDGVPMVTYDGGLTFHYNSVTTANFGLWAHDAFLHGDTTTRAKLIAAADRLIAMQGTDGAFRYDFAYLAPGSSASYVPGWVSGMAQGQALSVLSRAFVLTADPKYLTAGNLAFQFLQIPIALGGCTGNLKDLAHPFLPTSHWRNILPSERTSSPIR